MTFKIADRVKETCSAPGTGTVTLLGAVSQFLSWSSQIGANNTAPYVIADTSGTNWEVGIGTVGSGGTTLARTTVLSSSNSGLIVNFSSGTQYVWCDLPASLSGLSSWTTTGRPASPINGQTGYNSTTGTWEAYNNGGWQPLNPNVVTNYQQFTSSGTFTVPAGVRNVQVLIVGGGGGGGTVGGSGGGGGGVLFIQNYAVTPGSNISAVVGAGGAPASNGGYSQFDGNHIAWGGGGGSPLTDHSFGQVGGPLMGASGGGAGATSTQLGTPAPGSSQGSAGGWAPIAGPYPAGGGGGAGTVGGNGSGSTNGSGGTGLFCKLFAAYGQSGWFGGGGGGGYTGNSFGSGGLGGGGNGGSAGAANTGGGGGGVYTSGTNGGSGTVIVAWYQ